MTRPTGPSQCSRILAGALSSMLLGVVGLTAQSPPTGNPEDEAGRLGSDPITLTSRSDTNDSSDSSKPIPADPNLEDPPAELFVHANHAYEEGDYGRAVLYYRTLVEGNRRDGRLFYNLGNALLRLGEIGPAVAAYRQSLARRPRDQDLRANLEFARRSTRDALEPPSPSSVASTLFFWHYRLSRRELAAGLLAVNFLFWGLWALVRLRRSRSAPLKAATVICGLVALALGASLAVRSLVPEKVAVVLPAEITAYSGPGADAVERFLLHAGAELAVEGERDDWIRVALPSGPQGWVAAEQVEVVEW